MTLTLAIVVVIALLFDFTNGFHDTANSIATMIGTRAVTPQVALFMATTLNFCGAFVSLKVAGTIGKDIINPSVVSLNVVMAGLTGAITWNLITWFYGLPSSSSHALVGGLIGSALVSSGPSAVQWNGVTHKILIPSVIAPLLGFFVALLVMAALMHMFQHSQPGRSNRSFKRAQIFSGGWLSFTHGMNDAQKTMGIIALALVTTGNLPTDFTAPPMWVVFSAASAMALGTYVGGWKIIKTLGSKVVKMNPTQGFAASISAATILQTAAHFGFPVSTTHCVSGTVLGAGASRRLSSVRWGVAGDIGAAWIMTLPSAAVVGAIAFALVSISPAVLLIVAAGIALYLRRRMTAAGTVSAH